MSPPHAVLDTPCTLTLWARQAVNPFQSCSTDLSAVYVLRHELAPFLTPPPPSGQDLDSEFIRKMLV